MKIQSLLYIFVFLFGISCNRSSNQIQNVQVAETNQPIEVKEEIYSTVSVKNYSLTLKNLDGKCVLFYKNERIKSENLEGNFALDFATPCEFVRSYKNIEEVQYYTYGKTKKVTVLIVTGGLTEANPVLKDKFQPQGCGREIQKIRIYEDKVEKGEDATKLAFPLCPSAGLEEVFYAA